MSWADVPLWPEAPEPRRPRKWTPRCEDCHHRIWSATSLRRRFGKLLGGRCYRKRARAARVRVARRITVRPPGHIPGQTSLLETL
jgi:hypothetical protein